MNNITHNKKICPLCKGNGYIYDKVNPPPARGTGYNYHTGEKMTVMVTCPIEGCVNGFILDK